MAEEREKKRKKSHSSGEPEPAPARSTQDMRAGELLRHIRQEKRMELEEVSSAIHVRVAQLRAIEEGHIESLPGMTYALGFVKSYASYLKLDPVAIANKFKTEHSVAPAKPDLKFPEPMSEHKMPDMFMIGAAVAGVVLLLGVWFFFSGGEEKTTTNVATAIPAPPTDIAPLTATPNAPATDTASASGSTAPAETPATPAAGTTAATPATPATAPASTTAAAPAVPAHETHETHEKPAGTASATTPPTPANTVKPAAGAATTPQTAAAATTATGAIPQKTETINIKPGNGRVVLHATQTAWVQVTDPQGNVLLKQVLKPGDRYYVPNQNGLQMVTSNAGGVQVYVDGRATRPIGNPGEIVRGVSLNPERLNTQTTTTTSHRSLVHD